MTKKEKILSLRKLMLIYEALVNPSPEETRQYQKIKEQLYCLLTQE